MVKSPRLSKKYEPRVEIVAESEQDFLARIFQYLGDSQVFMQGCTKFPIPFGKLLKRESKKGRKRRKKEKGKKDKKGLKDEVRKGGGGEL